MNHASHNKLVSFIWSIADDCLRDVYVRGKYRDVILPMVVLRRLDTRHGNPPLNLVIHAAPLANGASSEYFAEGATAPDGFHWHVEICPRLARLAGFETGTGFAINSVLPEEAARRLRGEDG